MLIQFKPDPIFLANQSKSEYLKYLINARISLKLGLGLFDTTWYNRLYNKICGIV